MLYRAAADVALAVQIQLWLGLGLPALNAVVYPFLLRRRA